MLKGRYSGEIFTLWSGGAALEGGFGYNFGKEKLKLWFGLGIKPYTELGFILKFDIPYSKRYLISLGGLGNNDEYGLSMGGKIIF